MIEENEIIEGGKFLKPHGLKGELNAYVDYEPEILEEDYPVIVEMDGIFVPFYVESVRPKGLHSSLVKIEGVDSQEEARKFVNQIFYLRREDVAEFLDMDVDEIMTEDDFVGYKVFDDELGYIGRVEALDTSTDNMLLLVRPDSKDGVEEEQDIIYIPFNNDLIKEIVDEEDPKDSELHLSLPHGIIDLN